MKNKELELEAEEYSSYDNNYVPLVSGEHDFNEGYKRTFIAGATSKYVEVEKLKAQLDILNNFYYGEDLNDKDILNHYINMYNLVKSVLQQKLNELENEQSND